MHAMGTVFFLAFFLFISESAATTRRVPQDFAKIQLAINGAVNGDTVLVSEGTYKENLLITKKITLASLFYQDKDTSHISKTIIDGSAPSNIDSASVVIINGATDTTMVVCGFTITGGTGTSVLNGAFRFGGGINIEGGGATIKNNIISKNTITGIKDVYGAGINIYPGGTYEISYWIVENNIIVNNAASSSATATNGAEAAGAALANNGRFNNNLVMNNTVSGVYRGNGGGVGISGTPGHGSTNIEMSNNRIQGNQASNNGGGMLLYTYSSSVPYVVIKNNIISGNSANNNGSAILVISGDYNFINNTITNNTGLSSLNLRIDFGALNSRFLNNIIWNPNSLVEINTGATFNAHYNCIRGGYAGTGNFNSDPLFVANDSLYHLSNSSPCIGAGISSDSVGGSLLNAPLFDYFNTPRPRAAGTKPDIGAVESDFSTDVEELSERIPTSFGLEQNFPNPFNPSTTIRYALPNSANVKLAIYDLLGREITTLVNEEQSAGWKEVEWNGSAFSSGFYFYKLHAGNFIEMKKMMLVK
ncbi:MAG: T9SS type A sorting domain-containing protein [Bacteroidota bacterium]